jgi:predicted nucleic acid-binding protein
VKLLFDTGVLGALCHPRKHADVKLWYRGLLGVRRDTLYLPALADFELRRELLRLGATASLRALDRLATEIVYIPLTDAMLRDAAALWAGLWRTGHPLGTADSLSADVILAAQARAVEATVVTDNHAHLGLMVDTIAWGAVE